MIDLSGKRLSWLDVGKGLGILLVIFAHTELPYEIKKYIYTFHVPLFFFLSGYLFSSDNLPFKTFFTKKFKGLIVPYLWFSLITYLWLVLKFIVGLTGDAKVDILYAPILGTFYAIRDSAGSIHNGTLWFVACLVCVELLFFLFIQMSRGNVKTLSLMLFVSSIIGYTYSIYIAKPLPWSIDAALSAVVFYGIGYLLKEYQVVLEKLMNFKYVVVLFLINMVAGSLNSMIDIFYNKLGNYILFYTAAISGILLVVVLIKALTTSFSLEYIGRNTFILLAFHQSVIFDVIRQIVKRSNSLSTFFENNHLIMGIFYLATTLVISIPIIFIINKYLPFLVGKKKHKKLNDQSSNIGAV